MVFMKPTFSGFTWVLPHHYSNSATGDWLKRWCSAQFTLTKQVVGKKDQTTKKKKIIRELEVKHSPWNILPRTHTVWVLSWSSKARKVTCNCSLLRQKGRTQTKVKPIKIPKPPNEGSWFCFHWLQVSSASKNIIMSFEEDGPSACQSRRNCIQKHFNRSVIELCGHRMVWVAKCTFIIFFSKIIIVYQATGAKSPTMLLHQSKPCRDWCSHSL